jgi:hypothetical protein
MCSSLRNGRPEFLLISEVYVLSCKLLFFISSPSDLCSSVKAESSLPWTLVFTKSSLLFSLSLSGLFFNYIIACKPEPREFCGGSRQAASPYHM